MISSILAARNGGLPKRYASLRCCFSTRVERMRFGEREISWDLNGGKAHS